MKRIKIQVKSKLNNEAKPHFIYLGRNSTFYFSSKLEANKKAVTISKKLTEQSRCISTVQGNIYSLYMDNYYDLPFHIDNKLSYYITSFSDRFSYCFKDYYDNQNSFTISAIFNSIRILRTSLDIMLTFSHTYKNYSLKNKVIALQLLLSAVETSIDDIIINPNSKNLNRGKLLEFNHDRNKTEYDKKTQNGTTIL